MLYYKFFSPISLFHQQDGFLQQKNSYNFNNTAVLSAWRKSLLMCQIVSLWFPNATFPVIQGATLVV